MEIEASSNPTSDSNQIRAIWRRSIPRASSSMAIDCMRWRKSVKSHAKSAKILPDNIHPGISPIHTPKTDARIATNNPSDENHSSPRHWVNNHTTPKIIIQRANTTIPASANPHATDPILITILAANPIEVTMGSSTSSKRGQEPDPDNQNNPPVFIVQSDSHRASILPFERKPHDILSISSFNCQY